MQWLISKNPIKLALVAVLWNIVLGIIISIIQVLLHFDSASAVAGLIAIYIVGYGYTSKYDELMSKDLRQKTAGYYALIQYVLAFGFFFLTDLHIPLMFWFILITVLTVILYFVFSWIIDLSGKRALKDKIKHKKVKS